MRKTKLFSRILMVALCAVLALSMSVLTPEVEAASETPITETNQTEDQTSIYTFEEVDVLAISRAKAVDEAKSEAESIVEELKIEEEKEAATEAVVNVSTPIATTKPQATKPSSSSSTTNKKPESSSGGDTYVSGSTSGDYLMNIANPDPNYKSYSIHLSASDRDLAERILMGEAGSMGYTGMALVAQSLRDAYVRGGYSDIASVIRDYGYYGSTSIRPSQTCKDVVKYIFDQGGSAVQHRVIAFYSTQYCSSPWHESQNFICQIGKVRFFDLW